MKKLLSLSIIILLFSCTGKQPQQNKQKIKQVKSVDETVANLPGESLQTVKKPSLISNNEMVFFEGGTFLMGSENGLPQEQPVHKVTVNSFKIDKSPVTVAQFRIFVETTNYKTEAEKYGDSGVFNMETQNWELLPGAFWRKPFGAAAPMLKIIIR